MQTGQYIAIYHTYVDRDMTSHVIENKITNTIRGRRGRDRMIVGFTTTCAISACHHYSCEFEHLSWRGLLVRALCDKVCQLLATGRWFSLGTPVSSTK